MTGVVVTGGGGGIGAALARRFAAGGARVVVADLDGDKAGEIAKELAPKVLVNVVAPGVLEGGITSMVPEAVKAEYLKHSAQKRFGTHEEVARSIAWLALENTYVTGQTMVLDGGL